MRSGGRLGKGQPGSFAGDHARGRCAAPCYAAPPGHPTMSDHLARVHDLHAVFAAGDLTRRLGHLQPQVRWQEAAGFERGRVGRCQQMVAMAAVQEQRR